MERINTCKKKPTKHRKYIKWEVRTPLWHLVTHQKCDLAKYENYSSENIEVVR